MKQGKSLVELAKTLQDIRDNSRDFLVPAKELAMRDDASLVFKNGQEHEYAPNRLAHGQLAGYTGIPRAYYEKLLDENKSLLANNVNHGFSKKSEQANRGKPETRMVRTYRDQIRAVLSSSYRRLDSFDLCNNVLPLLHEKQMTVDSSELTESRLYIKALMPKLQSEVKVGDPVQYGILITNSDVGAGAVRVEPLIYRLICKNGMVASTAIRKFHAGRNMAGNDVQELFTDETHRLTDAAFWAQVKDIVTASMQPEIFEAEVNKLRQAAEQRITNFDIPEVVELAMGSVGVSGEGVKENIIGYLANGADGAGLTKWGLLNGFTYAAQSPAVNYDQSVELERAGAKILELSNRDWRRIAESTQVA